MEQKPNIFVLLHLPCCLHLLGQGDLNRSQWPNRSLWPI